VALTAYVPHNYPLDKLEPGLNENAFYDPTNFTYPAGTYICEVEVDPATGRTRVDRFTAVDDFGNIINPMIVEARCTAAWPRAWARRCWKPASTTRSPASC
jgi:carbon-monoxide dehydrogenase large subunit